MASLADEPTYKVQLQLLQRNENLYLEKITEGNTKKAEYYLYCIKYSKSEFKEVVRNRTGLPWYKQPAPKGTTHRN